MHLQGKPVCSFDPEGVIFAAGVESQAINLYDLRAFDKVTQKSVFVCVCVHMCAHECVCTCEYNRSMTGMDF